MTKKSPPTSDSLEKKLQVLGQRLRDRRKQLGISAVATAEAAEMSRITLYRIEKGEGSVAVGAYLSVVSALGLEFELNDPLIKNRPQGAVKNTLPKRIRISNYKQLKRLAWQLKASQELTPIEALDIYERNWRHVDVAAMEPREKKLLDQLLAAYGRGRLLV